MAKELILPPARVHHAIRNILWHSYTMNRYQGVGQYLVAFLVLLPFWVRGLGIGAYDLETTTCREGAAKRRTLHCRHGYAKEEARIAARHMRTGFHVWSAGDSPRSQSRVYLKNPLWKAQEAS